MQVLYLYTQIYIHISLLLITLNVSNCSANICCPPALVVVVERKTWRMWLQCVRDRKEGSQYAAFLLTRFVLASTPL